MLSELSDDLKVLISMHLGNSYEAFVSRVRLCIAWKQAPPILLPTGHYDHRYEPDIQFGALFGQPCNTFVGDGIHHTAIHSIFKATRYVVVFDIPTLDWVQIKEENAFGRLLCHIYVKNANIPRSTVLYSAYTNKIVWKLDDLWIQDYAYNTNSVVQIAMKKKLDQADKDRLLAFKLYIKRRLCDMPEVNVNFLPPSRSRCQNASIENGNTFSICLSQMMKTICRCLCHPMNRITHLVFTDTFTHSIQHLTQVLPDTGIKYLKLSKQRCGLLRLHDYGDLFLNAYNITHLDLSHSELFCDSRDEEDVERVLACLCRLIKDSKCLQHLDMTDCEVPLKSLSIGSDLISHDIGIGVGTLIHPMLLLALNLSQKQATIKEKDIEYCPEYWVTSEQESLFNEWIHQHAGLRLRVPILPQTKQVQEQVQEQVQNQEQINIQEEVEEEQQKQQKQEVKEQQSITMHKRISQTTNSKSRKQQRYDKRNALRNQLLAEDRVCKGCQVVWPAQSIKLHTFEDIQSKCNRNIRKCHDCMHYSLVF